MRVSFLKGKGVWKEVLVKGMGLWEFNRGEACKIANIAYSSFKKSYSHIIAYNAITTGYYAKLSLSLQIIR